MRAILAFMVLFVIGCKNSYKSTNKLFEANLKSRSNKIVYFSDTAAFLNLFFLKNLKTDKMPYLDTYLKVSNFTITLDSTSILFDDGADRRKDDKYSQLIYKRIICKRKNIITYYRVSPETVLSGLPAYRQYEISMIRVDSKSFLILFKDIAYKSELKNSYHSGLNKDFYILVSDNSSN